MTTTEEFSTEAARAAAADDRLGEWVSAFLASPGSDNAALAEKLEGSHAHWIGPVRVPLDQLHRLAGPPGSPALEEVEEDEWRDDVDELAAELAEGDEPPPVIATWDGEQDTVLLEDGNHRVEAMRRAGIVDAWTIVGFASAEDRDAFVARSAPPTPASE